MNSTVQQVVTRFKRSKPACETTFALQLFNDAAKTFGITSEERQIEVDVPLTLGVREYIIDPSIMIIQSAYYFYSSAVGDGYQLWATSQDALDNLRQGWRAFNYSGGPWNVYTGTQSADTSTVPATASTVAPGSANIVGLDPPPNVTTGGSGYPKVTLFCTSWVAFQLTDYVPDNLSADDVWVDRMEALYAKVHVPNDFALRLQMQEMSTAESASRLKGMNLQSQTQLNPGYISRRRR